MAALVILWIVHPGVPVAAEDSPASVHDALILALKDERHARNTYQAVIKAHGDVRPFSRVVRAEERHIEALLKQFKALGYPVPPDDGDAAPVAGTLGECCADAVEAERRNVALYDRLIAAAGDQGHVRRTFEQLREASAQRHLPAFERCVARAQQPGAGGGRGPGSGGP